MCELLDRSLPGDVRVKTEFACDLRPVEVDPAELELGRVSATARCSKSPTPTSQRTLPNDGVPARYFCRYALANRSPSIPEFSLLPVANRYNAAV